MPENKLRRVKTKEACAYARMSDRRLRYLISIGKIDAYKDGRSTLVDLNSIDTYQKGLPRRPITRAEE